MTNISTNTTPVIDGYSGLRPVGHGGSASVHRADAADGTVVAIKILHGLASPSAVRRFEREADALTSLAETDGVVPIIDTGTTDDGVPYIVMPYFERGSLEDLMNDEGPLDADVAQAIVRRIGTVLTEVHRTGVYHRDLKPANVLLDADMRPWVCDFGVAQLAERDTVSTTVSYTLGYCPPEAFLMGRRGSNGVAVDVYALAATLWALLAGRAPFSDEAEVAGDEPLVGDSTPELGRPAPDTSDALTGVIALATDPDPARRPSSMAAFVDQLVAAVRADGGQASTFIPAAGGDGHTVSRPGDEALTPDTPDQEAPPRRTRRVIAAIAGLALVTTAVVWFAGRAEARDWILVSSTSAEGGFHLIEPGELPNADNQLDVSADWISSLSSTSDPETASGNTIYALIGSGSGESLAVIDAPTGSVRVLAENRLEEAWTFADRAIVEEAEADGVMCVAISPAGRQRQLGSGQSCIPSADGSHVAIVEAGRTRVIRSVDGVDVVDVDGLDDEQSTSWAAFSPDGAYYAIRTGEGVVSVFELSTGTEIDRLSIRPADVACAFCLQWNEAGTLLAIDQEQQDIELWRRGADPVVLDGYSVAAFRSSASDDVMIWSAESGIDMLDADRQVLEVSDTAYWITVDTAASPTRAAAGVVLVDGVELLRVESDASTTEVATLSAPVVGGSPYSSMSLDGSTAISLEVEGGRDVITFGADDASGARWTGPDADVDFIALDGSIVALLAPDDDDDTLLVVDTDDIVEVDVAGDLGGVAGFGDDVYYTRAGQDRWLDRIDRTDGEVETVLQGFEVIAFGTSRS